ncbi:MAG: aspartate kinase [Lentisphaerae bacterium]|jgi:aspartate kinase|nr:aspartate kinase [Lentisphaerota bacterium]
MRRQHTVEKIGGTSMSRFGEVLRNVIIGNRKGAELYNRLFVVSAYGGITNLLLENKKSGAPGVYGKFAAGDDGWIASLEEARAKMLEFNRSFATIGLDQREADNFVNERMDGIRDCLHDLVRLRSYGHFNIKTYLTPTRELLSAVGEAQSAFNSTLILQRHGINAQLIDLTGWKKDELLSFDEVIKQAFAGIDFSKVMPIITGYVKYDEGIMTRFDRGYSEIAFSKIAVLTEAREGIIHKEYHLSTGDPAIIGADKVKVIGHTNFDIADQLSDLDMEAIHSKASKEMELCGIPIRVKNAFEPEHPGTIISCDYVSPEPRVEMICGRNDLEAIEVVDPEMVGRVGYDYFLMQSFFDTGISYVTKTTNANTITHFVPKKNRRLDECVDLIHQRMPNATVRRSAVAIVSVIGSNMSIPGFLSKAAAALYQANINVLALSQATRQVNMQFIVSRSNYEAAIRALHKTFVEDI